MIARAGALLVFVSAVASAMPLSLPGFPVHVDGVIRQPCAIADLNGDGHRELVVEADGKVTIFNSDGSLSAGPFDLSAMTGRASAQVAGPMAVGDLDGDGRAEIAVSFTFGDTGDGAVVVVHPDGTPLWKKPLFVPGGPGDGPTLVDVDDDGRLDLVVGSRQGKLLAVDSRERSLPGFPVQLSGALTSPVSFGSLVRGGRPALAVGTDSGKLYAVLATGQIAAGFPVPTRFSIAGAPAFGDIDNDGEEEIVFSSEDFSVYAVNADGSRVGQGLSVPGFPAATGYRIYGGPALTDLDRQGGLDVVVGSGDGKIYAWNAEGRALPGFPVAAGPRITAPVVVGDGDRDGFDEVYAASRDGDVYAFDRHGQPLDGFPLRVSTDLLAAPVLGDLVPDENVEMVVGAPDGTVYGYRLERTGSLAMSHLSWPAPSHDAQRQGRYGPNPPRYKNAVLGPRGVRAGEDVRLTYDFFDLDGTPEPKTLVRWTLDEKRQPDLDGLHEVPGARVKKGQRWQAEVQAPQDYAVYREGPGAQIVRSNVLVVADTAPTAPQVVLLPKAPLVTDTLSVSFAAASADDDGDPVFYRYQWYRDDVPAATTPTIPSSELRKGEVWRVRVTPTDGALDGPAAEAQVAVRDSPPTAPAIALAPLQPTIDDDIHVTVTKPSTDADGDRIRYRYAFLVDGAPQSLPPDRAWFPRRGARKGQTVVAEVWATDGELAGPQVEAEVKLVDAPPSAPTISISPAHPKTTDALVAGVANPARDPDGDPVSYQVQWFENGQPYGAPGQLGVPASATKKGETWTVEMTPTDGKEQGPSARAEVTVGNSAPTRPILAVDRSSPTVGQSATVSIAQPSADPDGDGITYRWKWTVDGKPAEVSPRPPAIAANDGGATGTVPPGSWEPQTLPAGAFAKGQRWLVTVTPVDSDGAAGPSGEVEIRPRDTPPGAPVVRIDPARATIETGLQAVIQTPAADPDHDALAYRFRWYRNGLLATDVGDRARLKPGEVRHGDRWRVRVVAFDGEAEGPPAWASAVVQNVAPAAPVLAMEPAHPTVVTGLECATVHPATDADHDPLTLSYRWTRDGVVFPAGAGPRLDGAMLAHGQHWRCDVVASDGQATSPVATAAAVIEDAAPGPPSVAVVPGVPEGGEDLTCAIATEAVDPDGDRVRYTYRWFPPAGVQLGSLADPARVPGALVKKGQTWRCEATASDGHESSSATSAAVAVANTPPNAPRLRLVPATATAGTELRCELARRAVDPDGDRVSYEFAWFRNGRRQPFAQSSEAVPGRLVKAGDTWRCEATALDAEGPGGTGRSPEVTVGGPALSGG